MTKLVLKVKTNASTMFVSYEAEEKIARVLDTDETNFGDFDIRDVEDDSSWDVFEDVEDINEWLGNEAEILDEAEIEL